MATLIKFAIAFEIAFLFKLEADLKHVFPDSRFVRDLSDVAGWEAVNAYVDAAVRALA